MKKCSICDSEVYNMGPSNYIEGIVVCNSCKSIMMESLEEHFQEKRSSEISKNKGGSESKNSTSLKGHVKKWWQFWK